MANGFIAKTTKSSQILVDSEDYANCLVNHF